MKSKKRANFNQYRWLHKNKKKIVSIVSLILIASLIFGIFAQFLSVYNSY